MVKHPIKVTSIVSECSEISTIFALKTSTNHMIWSSDQIKRDQLHESTVTDKINDLWTVTQWRTTFSKKTSQFKCVAWLHWSSHQRNNTSNRIWIVYNLCPKLELDTTLLPQLEYLDQHWVLWASVHVLLEGPWRYLPPDKSNHNYQCSRQKSRECL